MNFIKKQQMYLGLYHEFYTAFCELDAAHKLHERTAYKSDALKKVDAAYKRINAARKQIEERVIPNLKEEVANAG